MFGMDMVIDAVAARVDTEDISKIEDGVRRIAVFIREYCGFKKLPCEIYPLWIDMTVDFIESDGQVSVADLDVASVTMGDASYSFFDGGNGTDNKSSNNSLGGMMTAYRERLNHYRRGLFR